MEVLTDDLVHHYQHHGYVVIPKLFSADAAEMIEYFMSMRAEGPKPGDFGGTKDQSTDPTHAYPRLINMHEWDDKSAKWAMRDEVKHIVSALIKDEAILNQTMVYFKPPGGRGQAMHQDQQYIAIDPLIGMWVALEEADETNGQMIVVPGSHDGPLCKVQHADTAVSFTPVTAVVPVGAQSVGLDMGPGDALFFHGKTIHGSNANTTSDRWRRSFACHYIGRNAREFEPERGTHVDHL
jgi:ectoine hydroxylase-related dioxygenase (phytanoyl-CoA dioxygenase family)